jgi:hypothetical protein
LTKNIVWECEDSIDAVGNAKNKRAELIRSATIRWMRINLTPEITFLLVGLSIWVNDAEPASEAFGYSSHPCYHRRSILYNVPLKLLTFALASRQASSGTKRGGIGLGLNLSGKLFKYILSIKNNRHILARLQAQTDTPS